MASTQTASINIDASATGNQDGRSSQGYIKTNLQLLDGTTVNKANKCYYKKHTIAASGSPVNLDFAGGGLIDLNGETITWAEIVHLSVKCDSGNVVNVLVGAHANPIDFGSGANTIFVTPGEHKVLINTGADPGYPITGGSADGLKLAIASGANQVIEVLAFGRDA
jgi:hypothetical protein